MVTFLRSKLYLNFWLFILKSASTVGVLTALDVCILTSFSHEPMTADLAIMCFVYFFYASLIGFVIAIPSYILMYLYLQVRPNQSLKWMAYILGTLMGGITLLWYVRNFRIPASDVFVFPVVPMLVAIFAFRKFTETHLNLEARNSTTPATVKGIY